MPLGVCFHRGSSRVSSGMLSLRDLEAVAENWRTVWDFEAVRRARAQLAHTKDGRDGFIVRAGRNMSKEMSCEWTSRDGSCGQDGERKWVRFPQYHCHLIFLLPPPQHVLRPQSNLRDELTCYITLDR